MIRGTASQEKAIREGSAVRIWCDAYQGARAIERDIEVTGSISSDNGSFVRRTASLTFRRTRVVEAALTRRNVELRISRGAPQLGQGSALPVFCGVLGRPKLGVSEITANAADLASLIAQDRFLRPYVSGRGWTVPNQISALVAGTLPGVTILDESGSTLPVPPTTWEQDRNNAISELAASVGCETFLRADRTWVIRRVRSLWSRSDLLWQQRVNLATHETEIDWEQSRNAIVVTSERSDGSAGVWGISEDLDPQSPTWVGFGRNTGYVTNGLVTTNRQAEMAAEAIRRRSQGARVSVSFEGALHPGVEAGDRQDFIIDGELRSIILDSFSWDLHGAALSGSGRETVAPTEEGAG